MVFLKLFIYLVGCDGQRKIEEEEEEEEDTFY